MLGQTVKIAYLLQYLHFGSKVWPHSCLLFLYIWQTVYAKWKYVQVARIYCGLEKKKKLKIVVACLKFYNTQGSPENCLSRAAKVGIIMAKSIIPTYLENSQRYLPYFPPHRSPHGGVGHKIHPSLSMIGLKDYIVVYNIVY